MKIRHFHAAVMTVGMLAAVPAFAQTTTPATAAQDKAVQKQHTDGGDAPLSAGATDQSSATWHKQHTDGGDSPLDTRTSDQAAAQWHKQHTDGGDSPLATGATDQSSAAWHKQHTQSLSHSDGTPADAMKRN